MIIIDSFRDFIRGLDKKEFRFYATLYVIICALFVGGIVVRHMYLVQDAQEKLKQLNSARTSVQKIVTNFSQVAQQRAKVDDLLKKDKNFYIQKYFQDLAQKINVFKHSTDKPAKQRLENGYTEENLSINLTQITTKQLCELLQDIENESRIYIKFVDITKMASTKKINVTMSIATLLPQLDS